MISVAEAEQILLQHTGDFGIETVGIDDVLGRVLAEPLQADRDMPPYDRATMDGIAIRYGDFAAGQRSFEIAGMQAAGSPPMSDVPDKASVQIMTGASLPSEFDTVVPIEIVNISGKTAEITSDDVKPGQFIHARGADMSKGDVAIPAGQLLTSAAVPILATMGESSVSVRKLPRVALITTGDELVAIGEQPTDYQIRRSNNYAAHAVLARYGVKPDDFHTLDSEDEIRDRVSKCLDTYDVVIVFGGVSMGAFDHVPDILNELSVEVKFHKVLQRPGKPLLFGMHASGATVFALPGNPVSTFMCLNRYIVPWLCASLGTPQLPAQYAVLDSDVKAPSGLHYFLQATLKTDSRGVLRATPLDHHGSGDFLNLLHADAFVELPPGAETKAGAVCRILPLKSLQ